MFHMVYGRAAPEVLDYRLGDSMVEAIDTMLTECQQRLRELQGNLLAAQTRMKKYADSKWRHLEFAEGDWVWLKLQPYRQHSVDRRHCQKLAVFFYGPFRVKKKISMVAYRLMLPANCQIFPVFHIGLLKPFPSENPTEEAVTLPPLTNDGHPIAISTKVMANRLTTRKEQKIEQVLVEWLGLDPNEISWEDLSTILFLRLTLRTRLNPMELRM